MWQLWEVQALEEQGFRRGAANQCTFQDLPYRKPTGLYANFDLGDKVAQGWPSFRSGIAYKKRSDRVYEGPLPRDCGCGLPLGPHGTLDRKANDAMFPSTGTARWPQGLYDYVARRALAAWRSSSGNRKAFDTELKPADVP